MKKAVFNLMAIITFGLAVLFAMYFVSLAMWVDAYSRRKQAYREGGE